MTKCILLPIILLLALPAISYEIDPNTVAVWRFEEGQGSKVLDSSGNGHHGKLVGNAKWTDKGKIGGAIEFDGVDSFVEVAKSKAFDLTEYTVELWFRAESIKDTRAVFGHGESFDTDIAQYIIEINDEKNPNKIQLWYEAAKDKDTYVGSTSDIKPELWYFFAATRDKEGTINIYLNGKLEATKKQPVSPASIDHIITIGCRTNDPTWKKYQDFFHGIIDEVRISNIARSGEEIQKSHQRREKTGD